MADFDIETKLNELHTEYKTQIDAIASKNADLESKVATLETAAGRPTSLGLADDAELKGFSDYLRKGDKSFEGKAMSATVLTEGGYTVPKQIDSQIRQLLVNFSPMRSVANAISVATPDFRIPVATANAVSAWVGEKAARPETASPTITEVTLSFGELYASPFVTPVLLEDSQFDIAGFVAGQVATEFARAEGAAFVIGDGVNKPKGLLTATTALTADATRAFGTVQHLVSSNVAAIIADDLIALVGTLKAGYRANAKFIMTKATKTALRSIKDTTGQYIFQPSLQAGMPDVLLGYPVVEMEDVAEIATGALPVAFGDFNAAYTIADRVGMSMLYNPYSNAPYIAYQSRKRVGGGIVNTEAYKVLKIK
jgi:HK97 family phage major capsid protein